MRAKNFGRPFVRHWICSGRTLLFVVVLIYTEDPGQPHVEAVCWVLVQFRKYGLLVNLKKCYVVSAQRVRMEDERICRHD